MNSVILASPRALQKLEKEYTDLFDNVERSTDLQIQWTTNKKGPKIGSDQKSEETDPMGIPKSPITPTQ